MSRAQESQVADTASNQNQTYNANAQTAFTGAQNSINEEEGDIGNYSSQLSKFAAGNPYGEGGEFQTAENAATANSADAASQAAAQEAQGAAVRGGQNANAGVAAGIAAGQQNERNLQAEQATQNADRIGKEAGYNQQVLGASSIPATLQGAITGEQGKLAGEESGAGNAALGIDEKASEQPGFTDILGDSFAQSLGQIAGQASGAALKGLAGCWIAAEVFDGWDDPRTIDVRAWLNGPFKERALGRMVMALYVRYGERVAANIRQHAILRKMFRRLFNVALSKAREVHNGR